MLYLPRKSTNSSATTAIPPKAAKILTAREMASYTLVGMIWKKAKCSGSCSFFAYQVPVAQILGGQAAVSVQRNGAHASIQSRAVYMEPYTWV